MKNVINFFAYGELMNKDIFSQHGLECLAWTTVTLSAWKVVFNRIPKEKDSPEGLGLTNIEPTPDSDGMLYGVLYEMDDSFLPRLDEIHNYPEETLRKVFRFTRHAEIAPACTGGQNHGFTFQSRATVQLQFN